MEFIGSSSSLVSNGILQDITVNNLTANNINGAIGDSPDIITIGYIGSGADHEFSPSQDVSTTLNGLITSSRTFKFFNGSYRFSSPVEIKDVNNVHILGSGKDRTNIFCDAGIIAFNLSSSSNNFKCEIDNLSLIHGYPSGTEVGNLGSVGIKLDNYKSCNFTQVDMRFFEQGIVLNGNCFYNRFHKCGVSDASLRSVYITFNATDRSNENSFFDCLFLGASFGASPGAAPQYHVFVQRGNNNKLIGCVLENWSVAALGFADDNLAEGNVFVSGRMESNNYGVSKAIIFGNASRRNYIWQPYVSGNDTAVDDWVSFGTSSGNWVESNTFKGSYIKKERSLLTAGDFIEYERSGSGDGKVLLKLNDSYNASGSPTTLEVNTERGTGKFIECKRGGTGYFNIDTLGTVHLPETKLSIEGANHEIEIKSTDAGNNAQLDIDGIPNSSSDQVFIRCFRNTSASTANFSIFDPGSATAQHRLQGGGGVSYINGDSAGNFGIGTNIPDNKLDIQTGVATLGGSKIQITGSGSTILRTPLLSKYPQLCITNGEVDTSNNPAMIGLLTTNFTGGAGQVSVYEFCTTRSSSSQIDSGTFTIVQDEDILGNIKWTGDDGTDLRTEASRIRCVVDDTPGTNIIPGRLEFATSNISGTMTTAMTIDKDQKVTIPGDLQVDGSIIGSISPNLSGFSIRHNGRIQSPAAASGVKMDKVLHKRLDGTQPTDFVGLALDYTETYGSGGSDISFTQNTGVFTLNTSGIYNISVMFYWVPVTVGTSGKFFELISYMANSTNPVYNSGETYVLAGADDDHRFQCSITVQVSASDISGGLNTFYSEFSKLVGTTYDSAGTTDTVMETRIMKIG